MATRYAVATGTIGTTTMFATTSGGVASVSAVTAADELIFDAASGAITATTNNNAVRSIVCTGFTGTLVINNNASALSIGDATAATGNNAFILSAGMTLTLGGTTAVISFVSTSATQQTINTAGKTLPSMTINGVGSSYILGGALTLASASGAFNLTNGTFNTSNFAMSMLSFTINAGTKTITFGSSAITLSSGGVAFSVSTTVGLTVSTNTAVITCTAAMIAANNLILNAVDYKGLSFVFSGGGSPNLNINTPGATIANLTYTGRAVKTESMGFNGSPQGGLTITGTLTINTNSSVNRVLVSNTFVRGTAVTITAASVVISGVVDFMDITGAGAATWTAAGTGATFLGDCGGNSGITTTTPITAYYYNTASANFSSASWFLATGGTGGATRNPLPQDDVIIDGNSSPTGGRIVTFDMPRFGKNLTTSGNTNGSQLGGSAAVELYGSWNNSDNTWGNSLTTLTITFAGRSTHTITMGQALGNTSLLINAPGSTYTLGADLLGNTTSTFTTRLGNFTTANYTLSFSTYAFGNGTAHTVTLGTSTLNILSQASTNVIITNAATLMSAASSTFVIANAAAVTRTISSGGAVYGTIQYTVSNSPGALAIATSCTITTLNVGSGRACTFNSSGNYVVYNFPGTGVVNGYVYMPGDLLGATIPDSAALSITDDIDIRHRISLDSIGTGVTLRILAKYTSGTQQTFRWTLASGLLSFGLSTTGADLLQYAATSTLTAAGLSVGTNYWLRVTREKTTGNVKFYYAADNTSMPSSWTQIGSTVVGSTASMFDSTSALTIGGETGSLGTNFTGRVYRTQIRNNVLDNGTGIQFDADFGGKTVGADTFTESSSNAATVTLSGQSIYGDGRLTINTSTPGTLANISKPSGGALVTSANYLKIQDIKMLQPLSFFAGANSVNVSGNTNIYFTIPGKYRHKQSITSVSAGSSGIATVTLPEATSAGNGLFARVLSLGSTGAVTGISTFALDNTSTNSTVGLQYSKKASGTETTITYTQATTRIIALQVVEYSGFTGTPTLDVFDSNISVGTVTALSTTATSGVTNTSQPALALAHWGSTAALGAFVSLTNSFNEDAAVAVTATSMKAATKELTTLAAVETTLTWTTGRANDIAMLSVYKDAVAGGGFIIMFPTI